MNIVMPYPSKYQGGTGTFVRQFRKWIRPNDIISQTLSRNSDVILAITSIPVSLAAKAHQAGLPIIQRLDGVVSWSTLPRPWYPILNARMKLIHRLFADGIIYQSQFSERCCRKILGSPKTNKTTIIYNGVDITLFNPAGNHHIWKFGYQPEVIAITTGRFRRLDQIDPIVKGVDRVRKKISVHLVIVGQVKEQLVACLKDLDWITLLGPVAHDELPSYLRSADLFLFSDRSACPNAVLEAMACGLPVVAYGRGAIRELVKDGVSGKIIGDHGDELWHNKPFDYQAYADAIEEVAHSRDHYAHNARQRAIEQFEIRDMVEKYIEFIKSTR